MEKDLQEKGENTCGGVAKPKDPPNPGDIGFWDCVGTDWVWIPASQ